MRLLLKGPCLAGVLIHLIALPSVTRGGDAYRVSYSKYRDISSLNQELGIERGWGERVTLSTRGTNGGAKNQTLDRFTEHTGGDFRLGLLVARHLELGLSGQGRRGRDEGTGYRNRTSENQLSLDLSYSPLNYLNVSTSLGSVAEMYHGTTDEQHTSISNSGSNYVLSMNLDKDWLRTTYSERGSRQEITEERIREVEGSVRRKIFSSVEGRVGANGRFSVDKYPTGEGKEQKDSKLGRGEIFLEAQPSQRLELNLGTALARERYNYSSDYSPLTQEKDREIDSTGVESSISYSPLLPIRLDLKLRRAFRHKDYRRDRSDEHFDEKSFNSSVDYQFSEESWVRFQRSINLSSYSLPHRYNFDDRDLLKERLELASRLLFHRDTSLLTKVATRDNRIIYIDKESSANNRRIATYEFSNLVGFSPLGNLGAESTMSISADYTTYQFSPERNTLVRSLRLGTKLSHSGQQEHLWGIDYLFTLQDQGAYRLSPQSGEWTYRKDTKIFKNEISLSFPLVVQENFCLIPSYSLKAVRTYGYEVGTEEEEMAEKGRDNEHHLGLSGNLSLSEGSELKLSGERVAEEGRAFWDLVASVRYDF